MYVREQILAETSTLEKRSDHLTYLGRLKNKQKSEKKRSNNVVSQQIETNGSINITSFQRLSKCIFTKNNKPANQPTTTGIHFDMSMADETWRF